MSDEGERRGYMKETPTRVMEDQPRTFDDLASKVGAEKGDLESFALARLQAEYETTGQIGSGVASRASPVVVRNDGGKACSRACTAIAVVSLCVSLVTLLVITLILNAFDRTYEERTKRIENDLRDLTASMKKVADTQGAMVSAQERKTLESRMGKIEAWMQRANKPQNP